jgi:capsid assembly protease
MKPVLSQFNQTPILIDPKQLSALENLNTPSVKEKISAQQLAIHTGVSSNAEIKPYMFVNGIAIISVHGALMHNIGWSGRYYTGYDVIRAKCKFAMTDPEVKGVLMKFHTPGGGAMGCPDTGDMIHELGKVKPVWTLSDDMAYSAGQWLHAQGTRRLVTQSGGLGSVGVVIAHVDISKALDDFGYKMSLIHAGAHKVDGNPYQKLPTEVKEKLQAECAATRERFAQAVSRGTGMSLDDVLATEAECYTGQDAVDIGFADQVVSSNTILDEFIEFVKSPSTVTLGNTMTQTTETTAPTQAAAAPAQEPQAAAPVSDANAQATERSRIKAITGCEEAKGREKLASYIAFDTEMSAEAAKVMLANAPVEAQQVAPTPPTYDAFTAAMGSVDHPNISADSEEESADLTSDEAQAAAIASAYKAATGIK